MATSVFGFAVLRSADSREANDQRWVDLFPTDIGAMLAPLTEAEKAKLRAELTTAAAASAWRDALTLVVSLSHPAADAKTRGDLARQFLASAGAVHAATASRLDPAILAFDRWLRARGNAPTDAEVQDELEMLTKKYVPAATEPWALITRAEWWGSLGRLTGTIAAGAALARDPAAWPHGERQRATRLFIVASLMVRWFARAFGTLPGDQVAVFLREARIRLPAALLAHLKLDRDLVRRPGFIDHFVVEQSWDYYQLGEIADVENVMAGEKRSRALRRTKETEISTQQSSEKTTVDEQDLQSSERSELATAAREEQALHVAVNASVVTSFELGTNATVAQAGGSFDYSSTTAKETASKHAREILARAQTRVEERIVKARQTRDLVKTVESSKHGFENVAPDATHKIGVYRWLEKVDQVQLKRYPARFVVEFVVPEPGAWLQQAVQQKAAALPRVAPPLWPQWLTGSDVIVDREGELADYRTLANMFGAQGIAPKPGPQTVGVSIKRDPATGDKWLDATAATPVLPDVPIVYSTPAKVAVPAGQRAMRWRAACLGFPVKYNLATGSTSGKIYVAVGSGDGVSAAIDPNGTRTSTLTGEVGAVSGGEIPVYVADSYSFGCAVNVVIECEPTDEGIKAWQQSVFDTLLETYQRRKADYQNALDAAAFTAEGRQLELSPGKTREVIQAEIKRALITLLGPDAQLGGSAMRLDSTGMPQLDPALAQRLAPLVLFFEEAFEWSTLSYILYPYYWGTSGRWKSAATSETGNPEYDRFVAAGSARVVVAARRGFESQVQFFLDYGAIWGGVDVPAPGEAGYLSVADEIIDLQRGPGDGELVDHWPITLPTSLTSLDAGASFPLRRVP